VPDQSVSGGFEVKMYVDGFDYTTSNASRPDKISIGYGFATSDGMLTGSYNNTYSISDHRGNKRVLLTNDGNNLPEVIQIKAYYPFGLEIDALSLVCGGNEHAEGYNGKEYKTELSAYDFGARLYDPSVACWFNADPLGSLAPNWSSFRFGYNSPLNWSDPSGMIESGGGLGQGNRRNGIDDGGRLIDNSAESAAFDAYMRVDISYGQDIFGHVQYNIGGAGGVSSLGNVGEITAENVDAYVEAGALVFTSVRAGRYSDGKLGNGPHKLEFHVKQSYLFESAMKASPYGQNGIYSLSDLQAGLAAGELVRQGKAYQYLGVSAQRSDAVLSSSKTAVKYIHKGEVYFQGNYTGVTNSMTESLKSAKFLKVAGKSVAVIGYVVSVVQVGNGVLDGKLKRGGARAAVAVTIAASAFIPGIGWGIAIGLGLADAVWGDQFYDLIEK
jgi:RHS repeat-associated protein